MIRRYETRSTRNRGAVFTNAIALKGGGSSGALNVLLEEGCVYHFLVGREALCRYRR